MGGSALLFITPTTPLVVREEGKGGQLDLSDRKGLREGVALYGYPHSE